MKSAYFSLINMRKKMGNIKKKCLCPVDFPLTVFPTEETVNAID